MSRIDYPLDKIRGIAFDVDGVLSPAVVPMGDDGVPRRMANLRDGYAIVQAVKAGMHISLISGADTPGVRARFKNMGVTDQYLGNGNKLEWLDDWMSKYSLAPEEVAYCGDDIPDLMPMKKVGLPVAPRDAAPEVKAVARYIATANGGYGVARELIEEVLKVRGVWALTNNAFGK